MASTRLIQIPDPIHGYIPVEPRFMDIVDTPEFQRLRSIEQGSFRPAYPGARHDRFIHSLGTYHLATKFVEHFFNNLRDDVPNIQLTTQEEENLKVTFRYAALLHDVGHAPFSHTTEVLFKEQRRKGSKFPLIWDQLCEEVDKLPAPADPVRFRKSTTKAVGAPHEIMSAIVLLRKHSDFTRGSGWNNVSIDPELAARMIIGYPYSPEDVNAPAPQAIQAYGIRNCLINLLNSKVMDVDRMDYLGRDTQMSGFVNAPVDLDCLARSVTAVEEDGWLVPAFREEAINVIDTMFHAKLSHDAWVLAQPAGAYDAALREHCIRSIDALTVNADKGKYLSTVFTVNALSADGVEWDNKTYRFLSDADILSDMKARNCAPFNELLTRLPGQRRYPAWRSYFEFRYLFDNEPAATADDVYNFFHELLEYMKTVHIFEFTPVSFQTILRAVPTTPQEEYDYARMKRAARFLDKYLTHVFSSTGKPYNVVLLQRSNNYTMTLDPGLIRIRFTHSRLPLSTANRNYATFAELRNLTKRDIRTNNYFYLYRRGSFSTSHLIKLRDDLYAELRFPLA